MASPLGPQGHNGRSPNGNEKQAARAEAQLVQLRQEPEEYVERLSARMPVLAATVAGSVG